MKLSQLNAAVTLRLAALGVAAAVGCGGCSQQHKPGRRQQARAQWNDARARVLLGLAEDQYAHGNTDDARKTADDALKLSAKIEGVYVLSAKLDIEAGTLQRATDSLAAAAALAPQDASVDYLAGVVAERWQRPQEALEHYQSAWRKNDGEPAYLLALGEALVGVKRYDDASALLTNKLQYFESSSPLRELLAQVYQAQGRYADAAEMFRRAASLAEDDPALRERQAMALTLAGDFADAAALLEQIAADPAAAKRVSVHLALGECRMQTGETAAARASFQRAARLDERCVPAWLGVAKAALALDEFDRADYAVARAAAANPSVAEAGDVALLDGYLRLKQGRVDEAETRFADAGRIDPKNATAAAMYGYCRQLRGDAAGAARCYRKALELDPTEPVAAELLRQPLANADTADVWP